MAEDESQEARKQLEDAKTMLMRLEDAGGRKPGTGSDCHAAYLAAKTAVQALSRHYNQEYQDDTEIEDLFGMLSPSYIAIPEEVQRATMLSRYAAQPGSAGGDCTDAVALAQNVVSWVEVVMAAGKPFIVG